MDTQPLAPADRVALLIKELEMTTYQFGKATGISHQTLSNVITGKNKPGLDTLQAIAKSYPAAAVFLLTGTGVPFPEGRQNQKNAVRTAATEPDPPKEPAPDYTSASATQQTMYIDLLKEQIADLKADKARNLAEIDRLRGVGKTGDSSDAADDLEGENDPAIDPIGPLGRGVQPMLRPKVGFRTTHQD